MAKPRVFVSSTYYDLKHLRSSIENFIEGLGYDPVLSEKDNIAFIPDAPLDESCYREARSSDVYVLIIGGRYGSEISREKSTPTRPRSFFERYESITKHEYLSAIERNIPTYILIDSAVDAEYQTFLQNKSNKSINYAHVDSVNIFLLIEDIRQRKQNNPVKLFTKYSEIEDWLREQWAGMFRELIHRMSTTQQIRDIDTKVEELAETAETLKRYMEEVVSRVSKQKTDATEIITQENQRLREAKRDAEFLGISYIKHLHKHHDLTISSIRTALHESDGYGTFINKLFPRELESCCASHRAFSEVNEARLLLNLPSYHQKEFDVMREHFEKARDSMKLREEQRREKPKAVSKVGRKPRPKSTH